MRYIAKIEREDDTLLVSFPDCPGCQTEATDIKDAVKQGTDALNGWLEATLAHELPPRPAYKGKGLGIIVDPALAIKLELRWARDAAGLTQAQLGHLVGMSQPRIAAIEHPDKDEVKLSTAVKLMTAMGRTLDVTAGTPFVINHRSLAATFGRAVGELLGRGLTLQSKKPHQVRLAGNAHPAARTLDS